jgi:hypothetical protein
MRQQRRTSIPLGCATTFYHVPADSSSANGAGFKALADYIHSLGLKFGIDILRGVRSR